VAEAPTGAAVPPAPAVAVTVPLLVAEADCVTLELLLCLAVMLIDWLSWPPATAATSASLS